MSKSELDIIHSASGKKMLNMVTEGFYDSSRLGLWLFEVMGREYDLAQEWIDSLRTEAYPQTSNWSIGWWEELFDIPADDSLGIEVRRGQILAKKLYRAPMNPERLEVILSALTGADVVVTENVAPFTFLVEVEGTVVGLYDAPRVYSMIRTLKPSHMAFILENRIAIDVVASAMAAAANMVMEITTEVMIYGLE